MKKKLIALAVAGAFVAPVAMADTTIYGSANVSFDIVNSGSNGGSANQVSSNASIVGLKGAEDLGSGTSAIWQIESDIGLSSSSPSTLASRDSFAGLSGKDWGTLLLGRHDTPYKMATRGLDLFADTIADNRALMGPLDGTDRIHVPDVVAYVSPAMGGVTVAAAYVAGAGVPVGSANQVDGTTKGDAYSLAAMYGAGPINVSLAYQSLTIGSAGTGLLGDGLGELGAGASANDKFTSWKLGGGYSVDAFTINLAYESVEYQPNVAPYGTKNQSDWYLAGKYNFSSSDAVKLAYTAAGNSSIQEAVYGANSDSGAKQWAVGYDHSLSKNTMVYALYTQVSNDTYAAYGLGGFDGIGGNVSAALAGNKVDAWSLGLKHSF
ncbi:MAG: porin [Gallionellaceae bacterium]